MRAHVLGSKLSSLSDVVDALDRRRAFGKTSADLDDRPDLAGLLGRHLDRVFEAGMTGEDEAFYRGLSGTEPIVRPPVASPAVRGQARARPGESGSTKPERPPSPQSRRDTASVERTPYDADLCGTVHGEDGTMALAVGVSRHTGRVDGDAACLRPAPLNTGFGNRSVGTEAEVMRAEPAAGLQRFWIRDCRSFSAESNELAFPQSLEGTVDVHRRQSECLAELLLCHGQVERVVFDETHGIESHHHLTQEVRHALLSLPLADVDQPFPECAFIHQSGPP